MSQGRIMLRSAARTRCAIAFCVTRRRLSGAWLGRSGSSWNTLLPPQHICGNRRSCVLKPASSDRFDDFELLSRIGAAAIANGCCVSKCRVCTGPICPADRPECWLVRLSPTLSMLRNADRFLQRAIRRLRHCRYHRGQKTLRL